MWGPRSALRSGSTRRSGERPQCHPRVTAVSSGSDSFSFLFSVDPYQILGPTSSRLANPGEIRLVWLLTFMAVDVVKDTLARVTSSFHGTRFRVRSRWMSRPSGKIRAGL